MGKLAKRFLGWLRVKLAIYALNFAQWLLSDKQMRCVGFAPFFAPRLTAIEQLRRAHANLRPPGAEVPRA